LPSKDKKEEKAEKASFPDIITPFSPSSAMTDYIKRFFYQIIGIYFPAAILFLYIYLFWLVGPGTDPINYYKNDTNFVDGWPRSLVSNTGTLSNMEISNNAGTISVILFLVAVVILGEAINALTARITMLSPVITSKREYLEFGIRQRPFPGISKGANWPIWLNETSFPVSFAQFDRYYVSALEQDKRTLAGKIGWLSFYRNMVGVFVIIFILQSLLLLITYMLTGKVRGYEIYVLMISGIAIALLLLGYRAQIKSNYATFWDAYKRYELRKNLEIRYGDLMLAFGIKDKYKTKALEYLVDRWYLGADTTIQTISRYFLTVLERKYVKLFLYKKESRNGTSEKPPWPSKVFVRDIREIEKKTKDTLARSYSDWNRGAYERVIANAIDAFTRINRFLNKDNYQDLIGKVERSLEHSSPLGEEWKDWRESPSEDDWKTILGFYILENSLRTDAAFVEISRNLSNRGWTTQNDKLVDKNKGANNKQAKKSNSISDEEQTKLKSSTKGEIHDFYTVDEEKDKKIYDQLANLIRETSDDYQRAFLAIMDTLKILNELLSERKLDRSQKEICFTRVKSLYRLFGGYEYVAARDQADKFFEGIFQSGVEDVTLESEGIFSEASFIGDSYRLLNAMPEGAIITSIINSTPMKLNLSHTDANGINYDISLEPYSSTTVKKQDSLKLMAAGEWNAKCLGIGHHSKSEQIRISIPGQIRIQILWEAPILRR
jgi:hypothetical protein